MAGLAETDHMPTESWWLDWLHFYARQKAEQPRMQLSRYGVIDRPAYGATEPPRPKPVRPFLEESPL